MRIHLTAIIVLLLFLTACMSHTNQTADADSPAEPQEAAGQSSAVPEEQVVVTAAKRAEFMSTESIDSVYPVTHSESYTLSGLRPSPAADINTENYLNIEENSVNQTRDKPISTFSIDVDTAAYANIRRMLTRDGRLPPADAVRLEEMVNYFSYADPSPDSLDRPFAASTEIAPAPWNPKKHLLRIGIKGYQPESESRPPANLVFLIDVSGSMQSPGKLPLLQRSLELLVNQMGDKDRIALVTYAGSAGLVLESTPATKKRKIHLAIENLVAGGSTHGSAGIRLAYNVAQENYIEGGINRILLASDGDLNVGVTNINDLKDLIKQKRKSGIAFSSLGFGSGNYNDALLEQLADHGNGNASYIDSLREAQKVLVDEMQSTLQIIAKDVKLQLEFNPEVVSEYRLLGYENRVLKTEDFRNDRVDAGEIGAGHSLTALYEIVLAGSGAESIPEGRYTKTDAKVTKLSENNLNHEIGYLRIRYKAPEAATSKEFGFAIEKSIIHDDFDNASEDFRFAAGVAGFAMQLRQSEYLGELGFKELANILRNARGQDLQGYRSELVSLVELAASLAQNEMSEPS